MKQTIKLLFLVLAITMVSSCTNKPQIYGTWVEEHNKYGGKGNTEVTRTFNKDKTYTGKYEVYANFFGNEIKVSAVNYGTWEGKKDSLIIYSKELWIDGEKNDYKGEVSRWGIKELTADKLILTIGDTEYLNIRVKE